MRSLLVASLKTSFQISIAELRLQWSPFFRSSEPTLFATLRHIDVLADGIGLP